MSRPRTGALVLALSLTLSPVLVACGSDSNSQSASQTTATKGADGTPTIDITVKDGKVTPNGAEVKVGTGRGEAARHRRQRR